MSENKDTMIDEELYDKIIDGEKIEDPAEEQEEAKGEEPKEQVEQEEQREPEEEQDNGDAQNQAEEPGQAEEKQEADLSPAEAELKNLKEENAALRRNMLRASGNASAAMKKLEQLTGEKEKLSALSGLSSEELSRLDDDKLRELNDDYGIDLRAVNRLIAEQEALKSVLNEALPGYEQQINALRAELDRDRARSAVMARHGDIDKVLQSEDFYKWRDSLPPEERAFVVSTNAPEEIAGILDIFKSETGWNKGGDHVGGDLLARRKKREKSSVGVRTKGAATVVDNGGQSEHIDEDAIYDEVWKRIYG